MSHVKPLEHFIDLKPRISEVCLVIDSQDLIFFFQINIEPLYMSVTSNLVIVASREAFYVWHFRTAQSWTTLRMESSKPVNQQEQKQQQNLSKIDRIYHVDDTPSGAVHSAQVRENLSV